MTPRGHDWVTDERRVAHLVRSRGRPVIARCGIRAPDPRWSHEPVDRCPRCLEIAEAEVPVRRR